MDLTLKEAETAQKILNVLRYSALVTKVTPAHYWVFGQVAGRNKVVAMAKATTASGKKIELGDSIEVDCDNCPSSFAFIDAIIVSICKSSVEIRLNCPECSYKNFVNEKVLLNQFSAE